MTLENSKKYGRLIVGQFSHVPSQLAGIPSPGSLLSCDKRLPLDTSNLSGLQENVFVNPRSTLESSQTPYRGIHQFTTPSRKRGRTNWKHNPNANICKQAVDH